MRLSPGFIETRPIRDHATKDHAEVCPVSRGGMFHPLSEPLQPGIRFLCDPIPAPPTARLAAHLPRGQQYGLTTFPICHTTGLGLAFSPEVLMTTYRHALRRYPTSYLLVQACQQLWLVKAYGVYQRFTCVAHASQPSASTRYCSERLRPASRQRRTQSGGYIVRKASNPTVTSDACFPRLPLVAQRVRYHSVPAMVGQ
ncbi:MAG: hypothetical protein GAK37_02186 [Pseudomonas sp.]|nr:MAG: hypothetical protein GAK37_02186 [Pseudomonas sp.]